nr:hypothetical protein [Tanacetum cinerariifolium]
MENLLPAVSARLITSGSIAIIFLALLDAAFENQFPLCKPSLNLLPTSTWWQPHPTILFIPRIHIKVTALACRDRRVCTFVIITRSLFIAFRL